MRPESDLRLLLWLFPIEEAISFWSGARCSTRRVLAKHNPKPSYVEQEIGTQVPLQGRLIIDWQCCNHPLLAAKPGFETYKMEAQEQSVRRRLLRRLHVYHHLSVLCDRMTCNDKMVSIFRHGINNDDIGPIAKAF